MKLAFFDVDGVLSIPSYDVDGRVCAGGSMEWWLRANAESYSYELCRCPKAVKKFLKDRAAEGVKLFVLSTEDIPSARENKKRFVKENYGKLFCDESMIFTQSDAEKIYVLKKYAEKENIPFEEVYYLDDTYSMVLTACEFGFDAHHVSEFLE